MSEQWGKGDVILGRWEVHRIPGGGMGLVYVVYDSRFRHTFAAKTLRGEFLDTPTSRRRFVDGAHARVNLDADPNLVGMHFVETVHGRPFILLE